MTQIELKFMEVVPPAIRDIAKELKKMNQLKALEINMKAKIEAHGVESPDWDSFKDEVDKIMQGTD